jgi:hypothetical protein
MTSDYDRESFKLFHEDSVFSTEKIQLIKKNNIDSVSFKQFNHIEV